MPQRAPLHRKTAPAGKDVGGLNPQLKLGRTPAEKLPPITAASADPAPMRPVVSLPKGKEDKLKAIALMQLRGKAVASSPTVSKLPVSDRWCLSWLWDEPGTTLRRGTLPTEGQAIWVNKVRLIRW